MTTPRDHRSEVLQQCLSWQSTSGAAQAGVPGISLTWVRTCQTDALKSARTNTPSASNMLVGLMSLCVMSQAWMCSNALSISFMGFLIILIFSTNVYSSRLAIHSANVSSYLRIATPIQPSAVTVLPIQFIIFSWGYLFISCKMLISLNTLWIFAISFIDTFQIFIAIF